MNFASRDDLRSAIVTGWDAALANPVEAVEVALTEGLPTLSGVVSAVLVALGYPDGSPRQETPTDEMTS